MVWAFLLLDLAILLAAAAASLCPAALARALPFVPPPGLAAGSWDWLAAFAAFAALAALVASTLITARRRETGRLRSLLELLVVYAPATAYVWAVLPAGRLRWADAAALAALAALAIWILSRARGDPAAGAVPFRSAWRDHQCRDFGSAVRLLAVPTAIMVAVPLALGLVAHARPRPGALILSLLGYPLFACAQLLLLLVLPWPRLSRLARSPVEAVAATAALFALAHWPNGPLMAACFVAMLVWAGVYRARPSLPALALSMGLTATAAVQMLPSDWLAHARVGPGYLRFRVVKELVANAGPGTAPEAFVRDIYPAVVGREAKPEEVEAWQAALSRLQRERIAWQFLDSEEHRARTAGPAPPRGVRWSDLDEPWRSRLAAYGSATAFGAAGGDERAFLVLLYRELLGRDASAAELAAWKLAFDLAPIQREHLVETLYDHRRDLARPGGAAPVIAALRLP